VSRVVAVWSCRRLTLTYPRFVGCLDLTVSGFDSVPFVSLHYDVIISDLVNRYGMMLFYLGIKVYYHVCYRE
jgi:hypothetical protein